MQKNTNLKLKKRPVYRNDSCMWAKNCNAIYTTECPIYSYYSILGVNGLLPTCGTHKIQLQPKLDGSYKKENANQYDSQRY